MNKKPKPLALSCPRFCVGLKDCNCGEFERLIMKPKAEWEKEFDNKFVDWNSPSNITQYHGAQKTTDAIKDFIRSQRSQLLKSLVEEVGGIEKETSIHDGHSTSDGWCYTCQKTTNDGTEPNGIGIYNQALKDIIKVIKKHQE